MDDRLKAVVMLNFVRISSFELPQQYHLRKCCVETSTVVFAISTITTSLRRPRPSDHRIDAGRSPGSCEAARASVNICRTRPCCGKPAARRRCLLAIDRRDRQTVRDGRTPDRYIDAVRPASPNCVAVVRFAFLCVRL